MSWKNYNRNILKKNEMFFKTIILQTKENNKWKWNFLVGLILIS
jgi:hypothetical protein